MKQHKFVGKTPQRKRPMKGQFWHVDTDIGPMGTYRGGSIEWVNPDSR